MCCFYKTGDPKYDEAVAKFEAAEKKMVDSGKFTWEQLLPNKGANGCIACEAAKLVQEPIPG